MVCSQNVGTHSEKWNKGVLGLETLKGFNDLTRELGTCQSRNDPIRSLVPEIQYKLRILRFMVTISQIITYEQIGVEGVIPAIHFFQLNTFELYKIAP